MVSNKALISVLILSVIYLRSDSLSSGQLNYENAINKSNQYLVDFSEKYQIPGIVAGVSINGTQVWTHAVGLTDIENDVKTRVDSVWRMASISKTFLSVLVGRLVDQGRIDLNKSIHEYLKPSVFPHKTWKNKSVTITVGQVMSHTAGIYCAEWPTYLFKNLIYKNVTDTIAPYKDKPLLFEPGSPGHWNYSNYGFQLMGALLESVLNDSYETAINKMFKELDMNSTFCERRERIVPHRARYYQLVPDSEQKLKIENTDIVDDLVSFEAQWPSGGIVSTVPDLLRFGSNMIHWFKGRNDTKTCNTVVTD